jgi:hypothetical protein
MVTRRKARHLDARQSTERHKYSLLCGQRWLAWHAAQSPADARPVQRIYKCCDKLDTVALLAAFRLVVRRHPSLRLRLAARNGTWRQYFTNEPADIAGLIIRDRTAAIRMAYARHVLQEESSTPIDLTRAPPFRAKLIKFDGQHIFSLSIDHIAADDIAFDVLIQQLEQAYRREITGQPHPELDADQAFFDYVRHESVRHAEEPANLDYWKSQLAGAPVTQPEGHTDNWVPGRADQWVIGGDAFQELQNACRIHRCSVFHAVVSALAYLIGGLRGGNDIVLNLPVSNRARAADHGIVGNLSMLLHVRFRLQDRAPSPAGLRMVRDHIAEAMVHRHYDYRRLSRALASAASKRGGVFDWLTGCSYIAERDELEAAGELFTERYDQGPRQRFEIVRGACVMTCRADKKRICFSVERDASQRLDDAADLPQRYCALLGAAVGLGSFTPKLLAA